MEELACEICSYNFDETTVVPKVLECGHSICSPCLTKLLSTNPLCPKCRASINNSSNSYPTNYVVLSLSSAQCAYNNLACHIKCRCLALKKRFLVRKDDLTKKKNELSSNLEIIKSDLVRLQELMDTDSDDSDLHHASEVLSTLEVDIRNVDGSLHFNYWKNRISVSLSLSAFDSPNDFLNEIYNVLTLGRQIISIHHVEDKVKYGVLSLQNNMILVHALSLSEIPENVETLWLNDMKKCITTENFRTFLKLSCNERGIIHTVVIEMLDSQLMPQFVKLCTGEKGPSYKGTKFAQGASIYGADSIMHVHKYIENNVEASGSIEYAMDLTISRNFQTGDLIVKGWPKGDFQILRSNGIYSFGEVLGKVATPTNLQDLISYRNAEKLKVIDSGFLFSL